MTDPTPTLSPAAKAVLDAALPHMVHRYAAAAALRAAAIYCTRDRRVLMTIAAELEAAQ
jgi:hypothetical protein